MQIENLISMYCCSESSEHDCAEVVTFLGFRIKLLKGFCISPLWE